MSGVASDSEQLVPTLVYEPGPRDALEQVSATRSRAIVTLTHEVRGRALIFAPTPDARWTLAAACAGAPRPVEPGSCHQFNR